MRRIYKSRLYATDKSELIQVVAGKGYKVELRTTKPHDNPFLYIEGTPQSIFARYDTIENRLVGTQRIMPCSYAEATRIIGSLTA